MKRALNLLLGLAVFGPLLLFTASSSKVYGVAADETIVSRTAGSMVSNCITSPQATARR